MIRVKAIVWIALLLGGLASGQEQNDEREFKVFGYFQVSLSHEKSLTAPGYIKSFNLQQLNLFLKKQLTPNWTVFVNFEFVNSYSSFRNWGAHNLEEAWVSYRASNQLKLKLGLLVPTFNNLNEIKSKTPLLPYIIRPLVYESSFNEIVALEEFVPARAFVQAYGFIPAGETKLEYAAFAGNSPNVNSDPRRGQTGVDTTRSFLLGGRFGLRTKNLKIGVSATSDRIDFSVVAVSLKYSPAAFRKTPRIRLGGDFSLNVGKLVWESEFIRATYDDDHPQFDWNKDFYYGTAGCHITERCFAYGSYWVSRENFFPIQDGDIYVATAGAVYNLNDMIFLKVQAAHANFKRSYPKLVRNTANFYFCAISVVF